MDIHQKLIEELADSIISESENSIPQCHYIIGERGYGKTSLLQSIRNRLSRDEKYHIEYISCLLCPELKVEDLENVDSVHRMVWLLDDFDSFISVSSEDALYKLRGIIYSEGGPLIIGTGRTLTSQFTSYSSPLYDSFMLHTLNDLDIRTGIGLVSEIRGSSEMPDDEILNEVFSIMGCTPESCTLLASLRQYGDSVSEIVSDALRPLDTYFKSIVGALTLPQRSIVVALLGLGNPALLSDIRTITGMTSPEIMSLLVMLSRKGLIDIMKGSVRKTEYAIHDKQFSAWYRYCSPGRNDKEDASVSTKRDDR